MTTVLDQITGLLSSFPIFSFMAEHNKHDDFVPVKNVKKRWKKVKNEKSEESLELLQIYHNITVSNPKNWRTFLTDELLNLYIGLKDKNTLFLKQPQNILTYFEEKGQGIIFIPSRGFRSFSSALFWNLSLFWINIYWRKHT